MAFLYFIYVFNKANNTEQFTWVMLKIWIWRKSLKPLKTLSGAIKIIVIFTYHISCINKFFMSLFLNQMIKKNAYFKSAIHESKAF